jgi:hypothetical protein
MKLRGSPPMLSRGIVGFLYGALVALPWGSILGIVTGRPGWRPALALIIGPAIALRIPGLYKARFSTLLWLLPLIVAGNLAIGFIVLQSYREGAGF